MYHVFMADDEPWVLIGLKNLIDWKEEGFEIGGEARDGESAWERISHLSPDLIISDIRMPGLNGLDLLDKIRKTGTEAEVIFISGYTDFEYARSALRLGCSDYLIKPVEPGELLGAVRRIREKLDVVHGEQTNEEKTSGYLSEKVLVKEVLAYIGKHYGENITLSEMAQKYRLSDGYFSGMIKKKTGKSFSEHLTEQRIRKAQEFLSSTNQSIAQIAQDVGYHDYFYFIKVYKKITGMTPAAYRKQF